MKNTTLALTVLLAAPLLDAGEEAEAPPTEVAVQVAKVVKTTLVRTVTAYGVVEPEPGGKDQPPALARLSTAVQGVITGINGVEGQQVSKGDLLFQLDSRAADAAVAQADLAITFAQSNVDRQKKLIAAEGTSQKLVLEAGQALAAAQAELAAAKVAQSLLRAEAPMAGTLVKFTARPGEVADPSTVLAEIADLDRLVASVRVPSAEAGAVKTGQKATLTGTGGGKPVESSVLFVSPQVDADSDTVLARLSAPKGGGLRNGGFVAARIVIEERPGRLAVPVECVYTDHDGKSTLSVVEGEIAKRIEVKAGLRDGRLIEVEGEGIAEGATVVTVGSYALPEETRIRILEAGEEDR